MKFSLESKGDWTATKKFLTRLERNEIYKNLSRQGEKGVQALSSATPKDSGETANSWTYEVVVTNNNAQIIWKNSNINNGVNIAIILQTGHGTGTGGYVQGRDYINPAMRPIFDQIANEVWKEVTR